MELQALDDLVGRLALGMKGEPRKIEVFRRDRRDRGAVVDIIIGREQRHRVDRGNHAALKRPSKGAFELFARS